VIFKIDFNEGQTWIQLCNGKIDEKANHLYTGVKNVKNSAWKKISKHMEITILPHTTVDSLLMIWHIYGEQEQLFEAQVLFTEYTLFKSKKEQFLADSKYKQNVINIF